MALVIYKDSALTSAVSAGNKITTTHPITGDSEVVQLWVANDDDTVRYELVTVEPIDTTDTDESTWIELSADGVTYEAAGASLSLANISDSGVGYTFYARVTSASVAEPVNKADISIRAAGRAFAV